MIVRLNHIEIFSRTLDADSRALGAVGGPVALSKTDDGQESANDTNSVH